MASILRPWLTLCIILFFSSLLSLISGLSASPSISSSSQRRLLQSNIPPAQNIQTFFPPLPSPAFSKPTPPLPSLQSPPISPSPTPPPPASKNESVTTAVVATAASCFAVSGLLFFVLQRYTAKRHCEGLVGDTHESSRNKGAGPAGNRLKPNPEGALKGVIVDENGLDVLYWRKLGGSGSRRCEHCSGVLQQAAGREGGKEEEPSFQESESQERDDRRVQERPMLPANFISSSTQIIPEYKISLVSTASSFSASAAAPPPPRSRPPPPPPAPPMPPAVTKNPSPPPPPLPKPPLPANKNPPSPPGGGGVASASPSRPPLVPPQRGVASEKAHTKLKPLHWDKVLPRAEHSMVWDKITNGSFRVDDDLMEALFGYVATNRKTSSSTSPSNSATVGSNSTSPAHQLCLLDPRKSQNIAIVIRSLNISRQDILDALLDGQGLSPDTLERLSKIAPTKDEQTQIRDFAGNPSKLADAESFLFHLLRTVPSPFTRIDAMLFRSNYEHEILHINQSLQALELASKELRASGLFLKLLEAILKAGNRMNAGTARGNAQAFNLTTLCKLSDVKSTDGKTTLLHFVVEEVVRSEGKRCVINRNQSIQRTMSRKNSRNTDGAKREEREKEYMMLGLPMVGGLSTKFANVKKAATIDYDAITTTCTTLRARIEEISRFLDSCRGDGGFVKEMSGFLETAEEEVEGVKREQVRVLELVTRTTEYYQAGTGRDREVHPLQLFIIVSDFLVMVDKACVDLTRTMQKRKPPAAVGGGDSSSELERGRRMAARFPNLPPHFMSDNLKSPSSSESEDGF